MNLKTTVTVVIVGFLLIIAFQNMHDIMIRLLFWEVTAPQLVIIPATFLTGLGLGTLLMRNKEKSRKETDEKKEQGQDGKTQGKEER